MKLVAFYFSLSLLAVFGLVALWYAFKLAIMITVGLGIAYGLGFVTGTLCG